MEQNSTKRQAMKSGRDRISELPDAIICEILSNLSTKEAVATTILSKRWKCQWTDCFNLDFIDCFKYSPPCFSYNSDDEKDSATFFVKDVIALNKSPYIKKFRLRTDLMKNSEVTACLDLVLRRNLEAIKLDDFHIGLNHTFRLPDSLFTCKTLVFLDISSHALYCFLPSIHLPNLKVFRATLLDPLEETKVLFCSFPVLEDLSISLTSFAYFQMVLNIFTPSLKRLKLELKRLRLVSNESSSDIKYKIFVRAPSLKELDICEDTYIFANYVFEELPSDFKARLKTEDCYVDKNLVARTIQLMNGICQAKSLAVSSCILRNCVTKACCLPAFPNITCLEVGVSNCCGFTYLPHLIDRLPNLVSLILEMVPLSWKWRAHPLEHEPQCLLLHLKRIEVRGFEGQECVLKLLKYLLKVAQVLDNVVIYTRSITLEERKNFCQKLSSFPSSSKNCQFKIFEKNYEDER